MACKEMAEITYESLQKRKVMDENRCKGGGNITGRKEMYNILAIPYKDFKRKKQLIKIYEQHYRIEVLETIEPEGVLLMSKRYGK